MFWWENLSPHVDFVFVFFLKSIPKHLLMRNNFICKGYRIVNL